VGSNPSGRISVDLRRGRSRVLCKGRVERWRATVSGVELVSTRVTGEMRASRGWSVARAARPYTDHNTKANDDVVVPAHIAAHALAGMNGMRAAA
jgi:hypothetical protein